MSISNCRLTRRYRSKAKAFLEALLYALGGGTETGSGMRVDEETANRSSAVFGCTKILAEGVSALPRKTYKNRNGGKGKDPAPDHPL